MYQENTAGPMDHTFDLGVFYGPKASKAATRLAGYREPSIHTPKANPNYLFQPDVLQLLIFWWTRPQKDNKGLWLWGPTGTGKSSAFEQFFARLNVPVFQKSVNGFTRFEEFEGHFATDESGNLVFQYGVLPLAMMHGGILLIDEADQLDPEVASGFHAVLDGRPHVLLENGGEAITPHPNFRIVCTGNTNGSGDETGFYQGVQIQNVAYMARFLAKKVGYMDKELEKRVLKKVVGSSLDDDLLDRMIDYANDVRTAFTGESTDSSQPMRRQDRVRITMEIRSLIDWALMTKQCEKVASFGIAPIKYALDACLLDKASTGDRVKLEEWFQRKFDKGFASSESDDKEVD
ncbi:AAA family ATPase [Pseudodesulfovibrio pelocollis]|uniref:AAA family ATPase n=1 Tax=Pseudodesulfovibrio pelocollis TaxID=3051432 RepID=UPI00255A8520|nr:AAA family ATPase [Pseudodesulfovibrio sp. SB368]